MNSKNIGLVDLPKLLVVVNLAKSRAEAKRLIKEGALEIDGKKVSFPIALYVGSRIYPITKEQYDKARID